MYLLRFHLIRKIRNLCIIFSFRHYNILIYLKLLILYRKQFKQNNTNEAKVIYL